MESYENGVKGSSGHGSRQWREDKNLPTVSTKLSSCKSEDFHQDSEKSALPAETSDYCRAFRNETLEQG